MQGQLTEVRTRLDAVERLGEERSKQIPELREVLDRATALLTASSADLGAKEAKAEADILDLQRRVEGLAGSLALQSTKWASAENAIETRVTALEQSEARVVDRVAPSLPSDKDDLWRQAGERLKSGDRDDGRRFYRAFIQRYPQDPRASQAYLVLGTSLAEEKQYARAAAEFQRLLDSYPRSPEVPEAMWQLSRAFVQLRFCTDARALLGALIKRFPASPPAVSAKREIKTIKGLPRASCTS
jgi:TolA-binding protein